jgi:alpha-2-macroglobulin
VSGVLEEAGDFMAAVDFLEKLLIEYPDLPVVQSGLYSLAQQVYGKIPELERNEQLRKRTNRAELLKAVRGLLDRFLALYPDNATADEVSFTLANSYLDDESYDKAIGLCEAGIRRYPKSPLLDSYEYIAGYSYFVTDRPEQALALCTKVATEKYPTREGTVAPSNDRWNAIHMIAQVYHASRQHEKALAEYEKVKTRFRDAAEAIEFLTRRALSLSEVTSIVPGKKMSVELSYRNVATCDLKVYKVDLMTLYLLERNLAAITRINLAGIKPQVERTVTLGTGKDYEEKKHDLELAELTKPGAYLLVCKSDEVECSGMLLISSLALHVQEDAERGTLRVNVQDDKGAYQRKVAVKVIGTGDSEFQSGQTDLRGVYEVSAVHGLATVIARQGDQYAFFRGQTPLGMGDRPYTVQYRNGRIVIVHGQEELEKAQKQLEEAKPAAAAPEDAKGNIKERLRGFQSKNDEVWKEATRNSYKGVAVQKAF